ncbi:Nitrate/nitrite transporter [hydrothermal vent metagenome]|uniref:Nitrate/nitrite transporter n=1 Tax=hydrothermal vent metagenome TaxID=652676 RepID=A0A1W1CKC5_9ZZZZ
MALFSKLKGQGHAPTLFAAFIYFDMSFMIWTLLGPLSSEIVESFALTGFVMTTSDKATLLSLPILSGAILRIFLGFSVDKFGAKKTALVSQFIVIISLLTTYFLGENITYNQLLVVALLLGFAGASFAVALPQAGQWYPPKLQGLVLGIAGAANFGVVMGFIFSPKIAELYGWQSVFLVAGILAMILFLTYALLSRDAPPEVYKTRPKKVRDYIKLLKDRDTWWFNLFYAISFGGFVGFGVFLKLYLTDTYPEEMRELGLAWFTEDNIKVMAGYFGALFVFAGTVLRPIGGGIADKIGGIKALYFFFSIVLVSVTMIALLSVPFLVIMFLFFITMANLGMANGAVFQLVPQRFSKDIGVMVGIVGAAGGLGGTALIKTLGWSKDSFDGYMLGFLIFAGVTLIAIAGLSFVKTRWRTTWGLQSGGMI